MFPGLDLTVQSISWASGVHHLSVAPQGKSGYESPANDSTACQLVSHQLHGVLRGQNAAVVSNEGNAVADRVVAEGVGSLPVPSSALVDVPVGARNEAFGEDRDS